MPFSGALYASELIPIEISISIWANIILQKLIYFIILQRSFYPKRNSVLHQTTHLLLKILPRQNIRLMIMIKSVKIIQYLSSIIIYKLLLTVF